MGSGDVFPVTPDYAITEQYREGVLRSRSLGGTDFQRAVAPAQRQFRCVFNGRGTTDKNSLLNWYREFEASYFVLEIPTYNVSTLTYVTRHFPVIFGGPPRFEWIAHEQYNMECELIEAVGCALTSGDYPDPTAGQPTATVAGVVTGSDKVFIYSGYGFTYTGAGTLALDGTTVTSPKYDVPLGLHRLYVTGGSGTLEVLI
jgi:hypothetical protein